MRSKDCTCVLSSESEKLAFSKLGLKNPIVSEDELIKTFDGLKVKISLIMEARLKNTHTRTT